MCVGSEQERVFYTHLVSDTWAAGIRVPALPGRGSSQEQSQPWHLARQPPVCLSACMGVSVSVHTCTVRCTHTCMHAVELWGLTSPFVLHSPAISAGSLRPQAWEGFLAPGAGRTGIFTRGPCGGWLPWQVTLNRLSQLPFVMH